MPKEPVNSAQADSLFNQPSMDRRSFLRLGGGALASAWPLHWWGDLPFRKPEIGNQLGTPWWVSQGERARVVEVHSSRVMDGDIPHAQRLDHLLSEGIMLLSNAASPNAGWQALLGPATRVAVVFNHRRLSDVMTEDALGRTLVQQLAAADYAPSSVTLVNGPRYLGQSLGCRARTHGWVNGVQLGENLEQMPSWLFEADAVINVPTLATDRVDGFTGGIGNLARSVVRHPGRYYRAESMDVLPSVLRHLGLSSRLKLSICNALTVIADATAETMRDRIHNQGNLILGQDPVATDTLAYDSLVTLRNELGFKDLPGSRILAAAQSQGLGRFQVHEVDDVHEEVR